MGSVLCTESYLGEGALLMLHREYSGQGWLKQREQKEGAALQQNEWCTSPGLGSPGASTPRDRGRQQEMGVAGKF